MIILWAINPVLLYRLARADLKMWRGQSSGKASYVVASAYDPNENKKKESSPPTKRVPPVVLNNGSVDSAKPHFGNGVVRRHVEESLRA